MQMEKDMKELKRQRDHAQSQLEEAQSHLEEERKARKQHRVLTMKTYFGPLFSVFVLNLSLISLSGTSSSQVSFFYRRK